MSSNTRKVALSFTVVASISLLDACADKLGSEGWCDNLTETPKGIWSTRQVADYAKYCVVDQATQ